MKLTKTGLDYNAQLIKNSLIESATNNELWFAIGTGQEIWDTTTTPNPTGIETSLINEISRVQILPTDIVFVTQGENPDEDIISEEPTSIIRVLGNVTYPITPLREFGLFVNGSGTAGSGDLYLYGTNPKIVLGQLNLYMKYMYISVK